MKANRILLKALPFVAVILLLKSGARALGYEGITLNAMFTGIIGAEVGQCIHCRNGREYRHETLTLHGMRRILEHFSLQVIPLR